MDRRKKVTKLLDDCHISKKYVAERFGMTDDVFRYYRNRRKEDLPDNVMRDILKGLNTLAQQIKDFVKENRIPRSKRQK